ncbi:MAG TPA: tRNA uridine-5-carboxymethylaminomethyl(34) synthesis GTPase MnmE [Treponemataceae bacterium]|nr:tRNA uridine-5-carboxymethylaminomethyl(34) synthesis GTPase MnmE [Treponemataceae bacterium]
MKPREYELDSPIAAIATALVPAALGIVRVSGTNSIEILSTIFSRAATLRAARGNTLHHGWITARDGSRIDEVMIAVYREPASFTGEESAEIITHGGPAVVLAVYRRILEAGFRAAERGEFTLRAFTNGKTDLARAEAVKEIIDSRTDLARGHAAERLAGNLSREIETIRTMIIQSLAALGVEVEYPEDEDTVKGAFDAESVQRSRERIKRLESAWAAEKLLRDGITIVLAGQTNAGKSSLFNTLLKENRAIVSDIHGTTRDWLEADADFLGIPVRLYDTAGIRETTDTIEAQGVTRTKDLVSHADIVLYVIDSTTGLTPNDRIFLEQEHKAPVCILWNKADHPDTLPVPDTLTSGTIEKPLIPVSAHTGEGVTHIMETTRNLVFTTTEKESSEGIGELRGPAPGSERQKQALSAARTFLEHACEAEQAGFPLDAVAQDLEDALGALGEITGETTAEDVLDVVFSTFCVGK